jgi:DNA-binding Lrp family transcriptional regulator
MGIADIANLVSISTRTANRILHKLRDYGMVRFSVICDPEAMKGFVVFGLLIYVNDDEKETTVGGGGGQKRMKKHNSHKIVEDFSLNFQSILSCVRHLSVMISCVRHMIHAEIVHSRMILMKTNCQTLILQLPSIKYDRNRFMPII